MKKILFAVLLVFVMAFAVSAAEEAPAVDFAKSESRSFDFLTFAKEKVLPDFHPTVKIEEAEANYDEEPFQKGDVIRAKVGIFYSGWIQKHSMVVEIDVRPEDNKVKVAVISDTNKMNLVGNRFFKDGEWISLAAVDAVKYWK